VARLSDVASHAQVPEHSEVCPLF